MEELIDVLDENGIKIGEVLPRSEVHKKDLWHRSIVVAIINEKNEILLQQRSANKDKNAGMWDISVAGHISTGQDSISAVKREINEEIGISTNKEELQLIITYKDKRVIKPNFIENQIYDFYILRKNNLKISNITVQEEEVQAVKWVSFSELRELIKNKIVIERDAVYKELENYIFNI